MDLWDNHQSSSWSPARAKILISRNTANEFVGLQHIQIKLQLDEVDTVAAHKGYLLTRWQMDDFATALLEEDVIVIIR